jgi:hypothetical protein
MKYRNDFNYSSQIKQVMNLNIFDLVDNGDKSISIKSDKTFRKKFNEIILKNKRDKNWKDFSNSFGISYNTLWEYMNRSKNIPLNFVKRLCYNLSDEKRIEFQKIINELVYGKFSSYRKIKIPHNISKEMVFLSSAIIGDGYLQNGIKMFSSGRKGEISRIVIRDQHKEALDLCATNFSKVFGFRPKVRKGKNHWYISFNNKIIFRYFTRIFKIPTGAKSQKVVVPDIVGGNSDLEREFLSTLFLFEGAVNHRTGYAEIGMMSKKIIYQTVDILRRFGIDPDFVSSKRDRNGWKWRIRKRDKLQKFMNLFCYKNTVKYEQFRFHLGHRPKGLKALNIKLEILFPRTRSSSLSYGDVTQTIKKLENQGSIPNFEAIKKELNRGNTITYEYLRRLEDFGILSSQRISSGKIWRLNYGSKR